MGSLLLSPPDYDHSRHNRQHSEVLVDIRRLVQPEVGNQRHPYIGQRDDQEAIPAHHRTPMTCCTNTRPRATMIAGPGLEKIRVPLFAVNFADDGLNPPELGILEREIR